MRAINTAKANPISSEKPIYWPADPRKTPDIIDFFVLRRLSICTFAYAETIVSLSSDHVLVLLTLNDKAVKMKTNQPLLNKHTNPEKYREELSYEIVSKIPLKTEAQVDEAVSNFAQLILEAAKFTLLIKNPPGPWTKYDMEIEDLVKEKRKTRRL